MVYSAASDDVGTISQFTRRKRIKLSHTGALTAYQRQLDIDYESVMQIDFSDIRFTTDAGSHIPHWIESKTDSVSADIWIKNDYNDGDTPVLMYYGNENLSSGSSIQDTFIHGFDGDLTGWTTVDPNSRFSVASNRLDFTGLTRNEDAYIYKSTSVDDNIILEWTSQITGGDVGVGLCFEGGLGASIDDYLGQANSQGVWQYSGGDFSQSHKRISSANQNGNTIDAGTAIRYITYTIIGNSCVAQWYSDAARTTLIATSTNTQTGMPTLSYQYIIQSWNSGSGSAVTGWMDDFRVRKHTSTEPTVTIGTEEHQRRIPTII